MKRPLLNFKSRGQSGISRLYAIIDLSIVPVEKIAEVSRAIIAGGAGIIQLRAKDISSADMLRAARVIKALASEGNAVFIVNDRADIALMCGADGVHLGQDDLPVRSARRMLGSRAIIGVSAHNVSEAIQAEKDGADYVAIGPIYATTTKKNAQTPKGLQAISEIKKRIHTPVVAIGGIKEEHVEGVLKAGADAVAVISDIIYSEDIQTKTARILALT
jgi:thiamine-phosphate diphosphorylase